VWLRVVVVLGMLGAAAPAWGLQVRFVPAAPAQGEVTVMFVSGARGARDIAGSLGGRALSFFPHGEESAALVGIDLETKPGRTGWRVAVVDVSGRAREITGAVTVKSREFAVQRLTMPQSMVDLDPATEARVKREGAQLRAVYETLTPERLWRGTFTRPVEGTAPGEGFGARRIINGQPRMPHSGVDYAAQVGTPVVAANRGRVALVGEFFFAGRLVVLDHGLGLHTMYFHLDRVDVADGALLERGEPLGTVGATGRVTGAHLHWGAELRGARVDPSALLSPLLSD